MLAIVIVFLLVLIYFLFKEIFLQINTKSNTYKIVLNKHIELSALWLSQELVIEFQFLSFKKLFYPFRKNVTLENLQHKKVKKVQSKTKALTKASLRLFFEMMQTFRLQKLKINVDTDDFILNAYLYPIFSFMSKNNQQLSINFEGNIEFEVDISNNIYRVLKTFLLYKIKLF